LSKTGQKTDILLRNRLNILVKVRKMGSTDKKHVKTRSEVKKRVNRRKHDYKRVHSQ
jgi:hypothetical protein